jgi:PKD repeat protein
MRKITFITALLLTIVFGSMADGYAKTVSITRTGSIQIQPTNINRYIEVDPAEPTAGQPATFRAYNFYTPDSIVWDMGDGTILGNPHRTKKNLSGPLFKGHQPEVGRIAGTSVVTHTYNNPGNYTVRAYDHEGTDNTPVTLNITVRLPNRSITYSPAQPFAGVPVQFNAVNFLSSQIDWNFGDGDTVTGGSVSVTHVYNSPGAFIVTARETNTNYTPVSVTITVAMPNRQINYQPRSPRVDQPVQFQALNFLTNSIDWNFGDNTIMTSSSTIVTHRYQSSGTFTVSAKDTTINHTPVTTTISVLPENRYITVSPPEVRTNEPVIVQAFNFRGDYILWDFGDGTQNTGLHTATHAYTRAGVHTITAWDENGESQVPFTAQVTVRGITDEVNLEIAEIRLDNGKYYKVVSKNSKQIRAVLRMKMRGTGIISGYWAIDGHPFEYFSEVVSQGLLKEIYTREVPGIPTIDPGIHSITIRLTRPSDLNVQFPELKYFVLPYENVVKTLTPVDGFIAKDDEIPEFSWEEARGANKYQIAFSNYLYPIMMNEYGLNWIDVGIALKYTPDKDIWNNIKRNRWTYWKVRALDTFGNVVAESDILDIKVVIATAKISINKVTDLDGKNIPFDRGNIKTRANDDDILVHGSIEYMGDAKYLVLRVYANKKLCDQLLFRDVKKGQERFFETSVPHTSKQTQVLFQVLNTSSPAVIVGIENLNLKK